jgi:DNA-binding NarL/FixJ family response regulator
VERARGRLRHADPEEALDIWLALFDGRWSVVEHVESDGRRYLLARRNAPGARDPMAVTQGERDVLACIARGHSNKYTAYLLGLATSTVSTRLESALRKLGLSSRREAIKMLAGS